MATGKTSAVRKGGSHLGRNSPVQTGVFAVKGDYWTLGLGGVTFPIKDIKGLSYIQRLLQHPGDEFHALDLLSFASVDPDLPKTIVDHEDANPVGITIRPGLTGDAGEMLDAQAKREYKRRLHELSETLEDQRERGNHQRADQLQTEIDFLEHEIERSIGRGGRDRRTGSNAERARLNVTRAIKAALEKIAEQQAALGELLDRSIRTGSFCSYVSVPDNHVVWQFSTDGGAAEREVPAVEPQRSRPDASFLRVYTKGTVFVGRDEERAILKRALDQAQRGEGKIVLIRGAAGVGKTRIAAEIATEASGRGMLTFVGSCYEREEPVPFIPFVEILEAALAQTRDLATFRDALGADAPEIARLVPQLRRSFPDIPPPTELPPEQSRRFLFNAVTELVSRVSHNTPSLFLLDDLQWADDGTLLLLNHVAQFVPALPIMIVGTLRDFELDSERRLNRTLDELIRRHLVERITLAGLPESSVAEMLRALSGHQAPEAVVRLFYSETEGNPFFVEELFRHLLEQGRLIDPAGKFRLDLKLGDVDVPQSLKVVIGSRLARLTEDTLKMLCTAAVIGRSFTFELLAAAMNADPDSLLDSVEEAENFGLIASAVQYPQARFRFSHELSRQTVISQVSAARRQRIHLQIGAALENLNAGALEEVAIELAHHFQRAGAAADSAKTIRYLSLAAKRARLQGALTETGEFYRDALMLLKRIPDTPERDQLELGLQLGIGAVLMATRGYADAGTAAAYQRASDIGERLGDPTQVVLALTGLVTPPLLRGELEAAQAIADQALAASQRHGKSKSQIWGHHIAGVVHYHRGQFASAWDLLGQAHAEYREEEHRKNPHDPGILLLEYMALTAWQLGMADTARRRMLEAVKLSDRLQKPFGLGNCSFYAGYLHALMRDPGPAKEFSEKAIRWCSEYSIQLYLDASRIVYGWAIAKQGRCAEGVACIRTALESFKAAGNRLGIATYLGFLAEALSSAGLPEEAFAAVEQGFSLSLQEPMDISYLWWLRGELFLKNTGPEGTAQILQLDKSSLDEAEKSFRTALSLATNVGAKPYAIRSATSLGRLLAAREQAAEARAIVEPLLKSMPEGFDTRDLVDAKQLLEDLS